MDKRNSQKSKNDPAALMDSIRKNPPQFRSINEIVSILHVISSEQRSCSILRSCVDKVLMNMSDIRSLRDIIERLRSVSRTNGLRFELPSSSGPETRCNLISDMFNMEILLGTSNTHDQSPTVVDVRIQHHIDEYKSCPHLVNIIRSGKFLELSDHLKGLTEMYLTIANRQMRTRVYLALQSLETDLVKMSNVYRETYKEATHFDVVMKGTVGLLTPRVAGERSHLTYYLSPYDLIDAPAQFKVSLTETVPKNIGLHAEVGIEQRGTPCNLPISPLISNKHSIDYTGLPRFAEVKQHNSSMVPACFVLYLKPAVPVLLQMAEKIRKDTNLVVVSNGKGPSSYLELLQADKDTYKLEIEQQKHVYHLNINELKGTLVDKVYFTHPGHVINILACLRTQAHLNTLISSCIRNNGEHSRRENGPMRYFDVSCSEDIDRVNITMENPLCNGTAFLEVKLDQDGFSGCKIYTGRGDPPLCTDQFVKKILQKCASIPITMKKLIEQSIKHPRKESDVNRVRPPALFGATSHPVPPNILTPVQRPSLPLRIPSTSSTTVLTNSIPNAFSFSPPAEGAKKVSKNPMLAKLLTPLNMSATNTGAEPAVQTKNHPMLMGLLRENDSDSDSTPTPQPNMTPPRSGRLPQGFQSPQSHSMPGHTQQPQFNPSHDMGMMGLLSQNSPFTPMDSQIPIPASHQMPPPSYPSHHQQNPFGNQNSIPGLSSQQSLTNTPQQFQVPHSPYSSQRSPLNNMDDTYPTGLSPSLISPGLTQHTMQVSSRGRRRQKSRSIESQHSVGSTDFPNYDIRTPTGFESQLSVGSDTSISELLGIPNRSGMTPLRRTDSLSPGAGTGPHMPLQHSSSLKGMGENMINNNLVTRSSSVGGGGKGAKPMMSPSHRNLVKTPTFPNLDANMLGSPPLFDVGLNQMQRLSRGRSFEGHAMDTSRGDFFHSSNLSSTSPSIVTTMANPTTGGSVHDSDTDPFTFDDSKFTSKISMPESTAGGTISVARANKTLLFQSGKQTSNTGASDTLRELAKSKPSLMRELTGGDGNIPKPEASTLHRLMGISTMGLTHNISSGVNSQASSAAGTSASFDMINKFLTSTVSPNNADKNLVRQNAIDKQTNSIGQGKAGDSKVEKTVKRRNSSKGEDGKPVAKKRGRPPTVKDHGGKRKKGDAAASSSSTQHDDTPVTKSIMLNIQLSSSGAPISSTTKTKPTVGQNLPNLKNPISSTLTPTSNSTASLGTIGSSSVDPPKYAVNLENYFKSQEELKSRMKKIKEKKALSSSPSSTSSGSGKSSSSSKQNVVAQSSNTVGSNSTEKVQISVSNAKPGSTSPRAGGGGNPQKRPRKGSIKDVIEKLHHRIPVPASSMTSSPNNSVLAKQGAEKDANGNLVNKSKSALIGPGYQKLSNVNSSKTNFKSASEDKFIVGKDVSINKPMNQHRNLTSTKSGVDLSYTVKSNIAFSNSVGMGMRGDISEVADQQHGRKDSLKAGQAHLSIILNQIQEAAAAQSAGKGSVTMPTPLNKQISNKLARPLPNKVRCDTPIPSGGNNTPQRKSPSEGRQFLVKQLSNSNNVTPASVKKSPSRQIYGGPPSRPNSVSAIDPSASSTLSKQLSSNPTVSSRKSQSVSSVMGEQTFIAPSISPTPKRTTSPQVPRTTSPLTRVDEKFLKGIPNRSPHRPSPTNSRIATPVPMGSPPSPDDRLVIDIPIPNDGSLPPGTTSLSRDEQRPVFLPGSRANERQSPERTEMATPLSPPGVTAKGPNLSIGMRRASTPRNTLAVSPSVLSVSSASMADSPCTIDDDLMDQAVTGGHTG